MEEINYKALKDLNISLREVKKLKKELFLAYEKTKEQISSDESLKKIINSALTDLALFKKVNIIFENVDDKTIFYKLFNANSDADLKTKFNDMEIEAKKTYNKLINITNLSFEEFLSTNKSLKELYEILEIKEKEARIRKNTKYVFWSIFLFLIPNLFVSAVVSAYDKLWLSIIYTCIASILIVMLTIFYIVLKKKINKIDKRNIYDKLSSIPFFFLGAMVNVLLILFIWNIDVSNSIILLAFTIIFNVTLLATTIGSMIIDSKLLRNKFEVLSISLLLSTVLLILEKFSINKETGWLSIVYRITLGILCIVWTISILYTAFFNTDLKKKPYKYFYIFIIAILITLVLWAFFIYEIFYDKSANATNILFNSIISVFAAVCGGVLTLGGVAWTIKNENQKTRNEKYSNILLTFNCKIHSGSNKNFINNSKNMSCNYYIAHEKDKIDENYLSITLFYKSTNYPLNKIKITSLTANKNTGFEELNFVLKDNIQTNVVQSDKDTYSMELVFTGKECVEKLKNLIRNDALILNISMQLVSMINIITNLDIEVNFEGIRLSNNCVNYYLNNVTYSFKED